MMCIVQGFIYYSPLADPLQSICKCSGGGGPMTSFPWLCDANWSPDDSPGRLFIGSPAEFIETPWPTLLLSQGQWTLSVYQEQYLGNGPWQGRPRKELDFLLSAPLSNF